MNKMKKYTLIPDKASGLFRIKALRSIPSIKIRKGAVGGIVASANNLDHDGDCWVYKDGRVTGGARVSGDARIFGTVTGNARVSGNAIIGYSATVSEDGVVAGDAVIRSGATVSGYAIVQGTASMNRDAVAKGNAHVSGNAYLTEGAVVADRVTVLGNVSIKNATVDAESNGSYSILLDGDLQLDKGVNISRPWHVIGITGACDYQITVARGGIICIGCQHGDLKWFKAHKDRLASDYRFSRAQVATVTAQVMAALKAVERRKC